MEAAGLYTVILAIYFGGLLGLGLWFNRRQGTKEDYFLARGKLGPGVVGFSYSATQMSGSSYMGAVGAERVLGYNFSPGGLSSAAAPWFTYILIGDRLQRISQRIKCTTLVDVFQARYYSRTVGTLATAIMLIAFVPLIAAQLKAAGNVFEVLLGMPYLVGLFLFGGIVIVYTVIGGMHAVAWTDMIQGTIMIVGFLVLTPVAVSAAGGFAEMHGRYGELRPGAISFIGEMPALWVVSSFLVWGFFQIGGAPAAVTRFLIPDDRKTLRGAMVYSIAFSSFIYIAATLIAISSGVLLPDLAETDLALATLVSMLLHPVFGGIIIAAVLGATMSTIDSILLLASSLVVENLVVPLRGREVSTKEGPATGPLGDLRHRRGRLDRRHRPTDDHPLDRDHGFQPDDVRVHVPLPPGSLVARGHPRRRYRRYGGWCPGLSDMVRAGLPPVRDLRQLDRGYLARPRGPRCFSRLSRGGEPAQCAAAH